MVYALVNTNGGIGRAASQCRVQNTALFRYTDDIEENAERHMPVDIVEALDPNAGISTVNDYVVERANCQLLPIA